MAPVLFPRRCGFRPLSSNIHSSAILNLAKMRYFVIFSSFALGSPPPPQCNATSSGHQFEIAANDDINIPLLSIGVVNNINVVSLRHLNRNRLSSDQIKPTNSLRSSLSKEKHESVYLDIVLRCGRERRNNYKHRYNLNAGLPPSLLLEQATSCAVSILSSSSNNIIMSTLAFFHYFRR